ncbi:MAG: HD domain-containing protein [Patescibacteria group bacterium]
MENKIRTIKKLIGKDCKTLEFVESWFYNVHLLGVERFAIYLLKKIPKADKEIVMLGVWLHDLQRIRGIKGNHAKIGAREGEKVMKEFGYKKEKIKKVKEVILSHRCNASSMPRSLEAKILSSADAMSHYINDFYLYVAITGQRNLEDYKKWALEKVTRDYNKKIYFSFAKKIIKKRHDALEYIFKMK